MTDQKKIAFRIANDGLYAPYNIGSPMSYARLRELQRRVEKLQSIVEYKEDYGQQFEVERAERELDKAIGDLEKFESRNGPRLASELEVSPLSGKTRQQAARFVNNILSSKTRGIFRDNDWKNVAAIWKALSDKKVEAVVTSSDYQKDSSSGELRSKTWKFEIEFTNDRNRLTKLFGVVTASFCGNCIDPTEKYDLVAYCS